MKINYASFFIGIITGCIVLNLYNFVFNDSSTPLENRSLSGGVSIPSSNENRANPSVTPESMQPSTQPESMQPSTQIVSLKNPVQKIPNPKSQYSLRSIDFLNGFQDWQIKSAVKGLLEIDVNNLKNVTNTKQFTARVMSELMSDVAGGQENDFVSQGDRKSVV